MTAANILADLVRVRQRFARSANVERDTGDAAISGYVPTSRALDVVDRIANAITQAATGRAVSIIGPYGSGKSSLALFLSSLLAPSGDPAYKSAHTTLRDANPLIA